MKDILKDIEMYRKAGEASAEFLIEQIEKKLLQRESEVLREFVEELKGLGEYTIQIKNEELDGMVEQFIKEREDDTKQN